MRRIYLKSSETDTIEELDQPTPGCWIHYEEATRSDLNEIAPLVELDPDDLIDCLDKYEIPRVEKTDHALFIFTRYPADLEIGLYTSTLTLILTADYIITISPRPCLFLTHFIHRARDYSTKKRAKLLVELLLKVNHEFTIQVRRIRYNVLSAGKEMVSVDSDDITALTKNEEVLNQYLSSLVPTRNVLGAIKSGRFTRIEEEEQEELEDCLNSIKQSEELCDIVLKSIRSLREAYQTIFTNNLHKTIKLLTSLTIILSIPTMIASVYGMNVDLPLAKNTFAFGIVMGFTAIFSIFGLWIFKKKGWL